MTLHRKYIPRFNLWFGPNLEGWIGDMEIDGPTFVPKGGQILPI